MSAVQSFMRSPGAAPISLNRVGGDWSAGGRVEAEPLPGGLPAADDRKLVRDCLALGGFPRIFVLDGKVFWLDAAAGEWAYGRAPALRRPGA